MNQTFAPDPLSSVVRAFGIFAMLCLVAPAEPTRDQRGAIAVGVETLMPPDPGEADEAVLFSFDNHAIPFTANLSLGMQPWRNIQATWC